MNRRREHSPQKLRFCGDPFSSNRLRSPDTQAPFVGRRTGGAAQKGRGGDSRRVPRTGVQPVRILLSLPKKCLDRPIKAFFYPRRSRSLLGRARQGANQSARMRGTRGFPHGRGRGCAATGRKRVPRTARPSSVLRPQGADVSSPRGSAPSPPFSFCRKKRTGRWSGPRDKTPWAPRLNVLHEARMGPWTPISSVNRPAKASLI